MDVAVAVEVVADFSLPLARGEAQAETVMPDPQVTSALSGLGAWQNGQSLHLV